MLHKCGLQIITIQKSINSHSINVLELDMQIMCLSSAVLSVWSTRKAKCNAESTAIRGIKCQHKTHIRSTSSYCDQHILTCANSNSYIFFWWQAQSRSAVIHIQHQITRKNVFNVISKVFGFFFCKKKEIVRITTKKWLNARI